MSSTYYRILLHHCPGHLEDAITGYCFEHGASGVAEALKFSQDIADYTVTTLPQSERLLEVFFPSAPGSDFILGLQHRFPQVRAEMSEEHNRDWLQEWKKGFRPFSLVENLWVVPPWCEAPEEAHHILWLEPGMAFGTGTHATTQMCARLLAEAVRARPGAAVLDVGTGTGILALVAKKFGAHTVVATDIEEDARRVARENLERNQATDIDVSEVQLAQLPQAFDVVVANIIDGVLLQLMDELAEHVAAGGALIVSGIIDERWPDFQARFHPPGFLWKKTLQQDEWLAVFLERA